MIISWSERMISQTGTENGPDPYGGQQLGIFRNGGNPDGATPRAGGRPSGCKLLLSVTIMTVTEE